jgi:hypothetical protein
MFNNDKITNEQQYPAARCAMGPTVYLYDHEASSGVESMNNANKEVRAHSAVDPVNSMMLLLSKEATRYDKACNEANTWTTSLTPKGEDIHHKAFEKNICNSYVITVSDMGDHHLSTVTKKANETGGGKMNHVKTLKNAVNGSRFGSCSCGVPQTKTIPCQHMVALVQSGKIQSLTELLIMPTWCMTVVWRSQFPVGSTLRGDLDINYLMTNHEPSEEIRLIPKIAAPKKQVRLQRKRGRRESWRGRKRRGL